MKRALQVAFAFTLLMLCVVVPAAGDSLQGLKWGFNPGDKFDYQLTMSLTSPTFALSESLYAQVGSTGAIPGTVNLWSQIPIVNADWKWTNGTSIPILLWLYFLPLASFGGYLGVPVGNWSLLTRLVDKIPLWNINTTMVENSAYWGMSLTTRASGKTTLLETSYLKYDGMIARYHWVQTDDTTHAKDGEISLVRQGLPNDFVVLIQDNALFIGMGIIILVLLAVILRRR
jgi:hypothetical protein